MKKIIVMAVISVLLLSSVPLYALINNFQETSKDIPWEYKSPGATFSFFALNLTPPLLLLGGYGTAYGKSRIQADETFSIPNVLNVVGSGLAIYSVVSTTTPDNYQLKNNIGLAGAGLVAGGFLFDLISGPITATNSSVNYLEYLKTHELEIPEKRLEYKDSTVAMTLSLLLPGGGFFYTGDTGPAILALLGETIGASVVAGIASSVNSDKSDTDSTKTIFMWFGSRMLASMPSMILSAVSTDQNNEKYYKQLLCPNSKYKIERNSAELDRRDPLIAFGLAALTVPGVGNMYADNMPAGIALIAQSAVGGIWTLLSLGIKDGMDNTAKNGMIAIGVSYIAIAKLVDMITAPCNAVIRNHVFFDDAPLVKSPVSIVPAMYDDSMGMAMVYIY